ncbi:MAG: oligosaccharide flippase family protein, partial [Chloroflexi bacterium]|nr:oligosaccharide flippase family protein [Chloroflexota bacterium]
NFRGVQVDEGRATVRFKYSPDTVKVGGFVSFLAGMIVIFLAVVWTWRLIYQEREEQTTAQRLAKNSIAPIALNLFNRLVEFAFAALMLRILGPANAGDYYYAINTYIWFDIITNFGLNTYLTREVARHREQARRYLLNTTALRLGLSLLAAPLLAGFVGARQTVVADLTAPASRQALVALALLYVGLAPTSIATGLTALFYAFEKAEYPAVITTVSTLLKVGLGTLVLLTGLGIVGLAGASIVVNVVTLALLGILAWRQFPELRSPLDALRQRPRMQALRREMVRESWPLMVNHLLATLFFKVDVSLMEAILGSAVLGLYSIGYKFLDALNIIPSMFTLALFPVISRQAREDRGRFVRFYRLGGKILITLALPMVVLTTVAAREMVLVLGGSEYLPGGMVALQWMAWSMPIGWLNSLTQYVLIALDRQRYLTRAYLFAFGFTLVANLWLMPRFGYQASAALHIASELMLLIPFVWGVRQELGHVDWWQIVGKPVLATLAMGAVGAALWPLGRWAAFIGAAATYGVVAWRLKLLSAEERALLSPAWRRK